MISARRAPAESAARLSAPRELAFECHGTRVRIRSTDAPVLALVRRRLPPGARPCAPARPHVSCAVHRIGSHAAGPAPYVVSVRDATTAGRDEVAHAADADAAATVLASEIEFRVALHAPARVFVHAAAVAWQGCVIAIPGQSFAGKSTLAAALVRAGARYFSDEFTVLDEAGLVRAFPRPIQLRAPDGSPSHAIRVAEGGREATMPLPLGLVVRTAFHAGARWRPRRMTAGQAALALLDNAVAARLRPAHTLAGISRAVVRGATVGLQGTRGDADETAHALLAWVGRTRPRPCRP